MTKTRKGDNCLLIKFGIKKSLNKIVCSCITSKSLHAGHLFLYFFIENEKLLKPTKFVCYGQFGCILNGLH